MSRWFLNLIPGDLPRDIANGLTREAEERLEKKKLPYNPAILLQNTYPKEVKTSTYRSTHINTYS